VRYNLRKDEDGNDCPSTLGEYLAICELGVPDNKAVEFIQQKINKSPNGENEEVLATDSQMRMLLLPMMIETA